MSWRVVVVASNAKVDDKMDYLVVRILDETRRVHISEIAVLMLESTAVSLTAYAVCELLAHRVKVIFCDRQLKAMDFRVDLEGLPPHEMLYEYLSLLDRMLKEQCFVLVQAKAYFTGQELLQLYAMAHYRKWNLLLLEAHAQPIRLEGEQHRLYDADLCELADP